MKREKQIGSSFLTKEFVPDLSCIHVKRENILAAMGMELSMADEYLLNLIEELAEQSKRLVKPRASYSIFKEVYFNLDDFRLNMSGLDFEIGKLVTSFLRKSSMMAVFVGTCGDQVEHHAKKLMAEGHTLEGYIVDLTASEMAESIAEFVHGKIEHDTTELGLKTTNRYSPGYCNWPVSDQHKLFSLIQGAECGIRLTPSSLMLPVKSVSGIVGIGENVKRLGYKCQYCPDDKCILRNKSY